MEKIILDTNALVSFFINRNPMQQAQVAFYLERAAELKYEIFLTETVLAEFVFVMKNFYHASLEEINLVLKQLTSAPQVMVAPPLNMSLLLELWPHVMSDYEDAVVAAIAQENDYSVLTFDQLMKKQLKKLKIDFISSENESYVKTSL